MSKKTKEQISFNMRRVKNKDSDIELLLRRELWSRNLHYRKNVKSIFGKPDIAFIGKKIAVFVDSEFWHGYNWTEKRKKSRAIKNFGLPKSKEICSAMWKSTNTCNRKDGLS